MIHFKNVYVLRFQCLISTAHVITEFFFDVKLRKFIIMIAITKPKQCIYLFMYIM
jgi:hypothetical protein